MLEQQLSDLRRCAACHDQCQFATVETFAGGSMVYDTSRKASLLIAIMEGKLELTERAVEVIYAGLSSGIQHSVCVYTGSSDGWPNEADWLRLARAEVVARGLAPDWAVAVRDAVVQSSDDTTGPESECEVVQLRGSISRSVDPDGHAQLRAVASTAGLEFGLVEGETGFEPFDLGFTDDARVVASKCHRELVDARPTTIVCDAPEAVWLIRDVWPTWGLTLDAHVLHVSEWLDRQAIEGTIGGAVGYHDPAALVRRLGVVDAPRAVLGRLGVECLEFLRCREEAIPAGSYYGEAQGAWVSKLAEERLASAERAGMGEIIVASPYDLRSLSGGDIAVTTLHALVAQTCLS